MNQFKPLCNYHYVGFQLKLDKQKRIQGNTGNYSPREMQLNCVTF